MSGNAATNIGNAVVLLGACFHLRHVLGTIVKEFADCPDLRSVWRRARALGDTRLAGIGVFVILAISVLASLISEAMRVLT